MAFADSSFPVGGALITMAAFFCGLLWIWLLITLYRDLFRRRDVGGWGKAGWVIFMLLLPYIGAVAYLVTQGRAMVERQYGSDRPVHRTAAAADPDREAKIAKAHHLLDNGAVTRREYEVLRRSATYQ